jgi:holliday junction DNA helicase RuvA
VITRISGTLEAIEGNQATVAVGAGLAYEVLVPAYLAGALAGRVGAAVTLLTLEYLESPNQGATFVPRLVGFATPRDRRFFELFTTVKGIGNRKALRALAVDPATIARAIAERDVRALTDLPEIGKRLAETVIAELSGKVEAYLTEQERAGLDRAAEVKPADAVQADTIAALMALGETRGDSEAMVARALGRGRRADSVEELLPRALASRGR